MPVFGINFARCATRDFWPPVIYLGIWQRMRVLKTIIVVRCNWGPWICIILVACMLNQVHFCLSNGFVDICGKSFTRNRDMVLHKKRLHSMNERDAQEQYKCRECHKVFESALSLSTHYRIHALPPPMLPVPAPIPQMVSSSFGIGMLTHSHHQGPISMMHSHPQRLY